MSVYFVLDEDCGLVKIGMTDGDVLSRLSALQTGCPHTLRLLGSIDGGAREEFELHERFRADRVRGEWFRLTANLLGELTARLASVDVQKVLDWQRRRQTHCAFCRLNLSDIVWAVAGEDAIICDECVVAAARVIDEQKAKTEAAQ